MKENKAIIGINEETGEKVVFKSINAAAKSLGAIFDEVNKAAYRNGVVRGWRIYPSAENIRRRIALLEEQLKIVEG